MAQNKVTVEKDGHVLLMGLNRPDKRNAFDVDMYVELGEAMGKLQGDRELWCGLVYGHGDHFTAGLDMMKWAPVIASGKFPEMPEGARDPLSLDLENLLEKPVIMAVQGICLTIGLELLLATDFRVASETVRFGQIEIKRGIYPVGGGTVRLFQEIGWGNAMRYLLTGDEISAEEALRLGLVQEVVPEGKHLDRALELAGVVASRAPLGVQASLRSAKIARYQGDREAISRFLPDLLPIMESDDAREGIQAFLERRDAKFTGR